MFLVDVASISWAYSLPDPRVGMDDGWRKRTVDRGREILVYGVVCVLRSVVFGEQEGLRCPNESTI